MPLGGTVLCGDESLLPPGELFDLVCAFGMLEHMENDHAALLTWRNRAREGGWILLSLPAHQHRFDPHDRLVGHFRRYDRGGMNELLAASGVEPVGPEHRVAQRPSERRRSGRPSSFSRAACSSDGSSAARVMPELRRLSRAVDG